MDILERMPWVAKDTVFQRLASIAEVAALSKEERWQYEESLRKYRDTISVMEGQYQEGMEKGRAEGQAEERAKAKQDKLETARKLKAMNLLTIEQIADATGLAPEEIESL